MENKFEQILKKKKKKLNYSFIKVTTIFSIGFVLFLISKRESKFKDQVIQNVRSTLKLPVNPDPRWKIYRSFIQDENPLKPTTGFEKN